MDVINVLLIIVFSVNISLSGLIFLNRKKSYGSGFFAISAFSTTLWVISEFFFRDLGGLSGLIIPTKLLYVAGILIAAYFFLFSFLFLENKKRFNFVFWLVNIVTFILISLIIFTDSIISGVIFVEGSKVITFGSLYVVYGLIMITFFFLSFVRFFKKYHQFGVNRKEDKQRILYIATGTLISVIFGLTLNIIVPYYFGNFTFYWLGPIMTIAFITFTVYGILKHRLFGVKVIATGLLTFILWLILLLRVLVNETTQGQIIDGSTLIVAVLIGTLLIRSVRKEVEQREKLEKLTKQLAQANERLKELDQLKTEFLSLASHQFRSPLTAMKGYASLILEGSYGDVNPAVKEAITKIFKSSDSLTDVVQDFLDVSRIEQGKMRYDFKKTDMKVLVEETIEQLKPNISKAGLSIDFKAPDENYFVNADGGKINQVLINLIDNAQKYTKKGSITILLSKNNRKIITKITDTGVGIESKNILKLFDKFVRNKSAARVNVKGTGLGLYIAKKIMGAHDGKIWVESEGFGKGSTFFVELDEA